MLSGVDVMEQEVRGAGCSVSRRLHPITSCCSASVATATAGHGWRHMAGCKGCRAHGVGSLGSLQHMLGVCPLRLLMQAKLLAQPPWAAGVVSSTLQRTAVSAGCVWFSISARVVSGCCVSLPCLAVRSCRRWLSS
eukprot:GHRQ01031538.1.p1 GENE.GHRQ01031538.1~~GHRQ01031538.1.p1  ORF type:complete len:136 (+),score=18.41 GHRQ01031538.1:80-487(+)